MYSAPQPGPVGTGSSFSASEPPLLLGRYRLIEQRDQGGFGTVMVAWDVRLQRRVAIKCLPLEDAHSYGASAAGGYGSSATWGGGASPGRGRGAAAEAHSASQGRRRGTAAGDYGVSAAWDGASQGRRRGAVTGGGGAAAQGTPAGSSVSPAFGPTGPTALEEALAEARASSFLAHPNIVTLHDFEVDDSYAYLVMEHVDGLSLAELLARVEGGVLVYDEVAAILASVASALAYAHENGVLHLDIKPANVLIGRSGIVKLGDFGMATLASAAGWGDARGGTVGYMPPEQLQGQLVDERTDVFALAAVCYEALTGTAPFAAKTPEASLKLIEKGPAPLSEREPELAGPVELAFVNALSPSPAVRMTSPEELAGEVLPSLGDPAAGRDSLRDLLAADLEGQEHFDAAPWRALDPPGRRIPWVAPACLHLSNALACGVLAWRLGPHLGLTSWTASGLAALAAAGAGAAWAPAGAAVGVALLALALPWGNVTPVTLLSALVVAGLGALWLARASRRSTLSAAALLAAPALAAGSLTPGVAGYVLAPGPAAATAALASLLAQVVRATGLLDGAAAPEAAGFLNLLGNPGTWIWVAAAAAGAAACAFVTQRGTRASALAGQWVAWALLECGLLASGALENAGIWAQALSAPGAVAVGSTILMSVLVALFGSSESRREGD